MNFVECDAQELCWRVNKLEKGFQIPLPVQLCFQVFFLQQSET